MELGPKEHPNNGFGRPNFVTIIVVHMNPLGTRITPKGPST